MINKPQIKSNSTPCEVVEYNQLNTMNSCYPLQNSCPQIIVQSPEPATNPLPYAANPTLFDLQSAGSTGSLRVHQNSIVKVTGVGCDVTTSQTVENQTEINNIKISVIGGVGGAAYSGGQFITVLGSVISADLSTAQVGSILPAGKGFVANDNKYYTSIPYSMVSGVPSGLSETPNSFVTTPTFTITGSGTANRILTGNVNISSNAGNILVNNSGLYVPAPVYPVYTANAGVKLIGNNFSLDTTTIPANSIPTSTINNFASSVLANLNGGSLPANGVYNVNVISGAATLTPIVSGGGTTYSGSPSVSISGTNVLTTNAVGVAAGFTPNTLIPSGVGILGSNGQSFSSIPASMVTGLPTFTETANTVGTSSTVLLTATGGFSRNINATVKVSAALGNIITVNADGLYAAASTSGGTNYVGGTGIIISGNSISTNSTQIAAQFTDTNLPLPVGTRLLAEDGLTYILPTPSGTNVVAGTGLTLTGNTLSTSGTQIGALFTSGGSLPNGQTVLGSNGQAYTIPAATGGAAQAFVSGANTVLSGTGVAGTPFKYDVAYSADAQNVAINGTDGKVFAPSLARQANSLSIPATSFSGTATPAESMLVTDGTTVRRVAPKYRFNETITVSSGFFAAANDVSDVQNVTVLASKVDVIKTRISTDANVTANTVYNILKNGTQVATGTIPAGQLQIVISTAYSFVDNDNLQLQYVSGDITPQIDAVIAGWEY